MIISYFFESYITIEVYTKKMRLATHVGNLILTT